MARCSSRRDVAEQIWPFVQKHPNCTARVAPGIRVLAIKLGK